MNPQQRLWFEQTASDHSVLLLLRQEGAAPCHQLHYLQMVTEKLGKAYFWRSGSQPPKSHVSFVRFLQALNDHRSRGEADRIANVLGFHKKTALKTWIQTISPLAHDLQKLAPALAGDHGPNPEYPWPGTAPIYAPSSFRFPIWLSLTESSRGRRLVQFIDTAVIEFPNYC